jgi:large subunit ribosomal protein L24
MPHRKGTLKPGKQRKLAFTAPSHIRRKLLAAPLSSALRERYGVRAFPVRKGDTVKILRGDFSGIEGKVSETSTEKGRVFVEGVTREKVSGTSTKVSVHVSKVMITNLNLDDKWRAQSLERRKRTRETEAAAEKKEA